MCPHARKRAPSVRILKIEISSKTKRRDGLHYNPPNGTKLGRKIEKPKPKNPNRCLAFPEQADRNISRKTDRLADKANRTTERNNADKQKSHKDRPKAD